MKFKHLRIEEREILQVMHWQKKPIREMARKLNRSPSSISRELRRNFPPEHRVYTPRLAHERALKKRRNRGRADRLKNEVIRQYVVDHLKERWSPEQIAGRLKRQGLGSISHEAIYQYIYAQIHRDGYGLLRPNALDLRSCLRRRRKRRGHRGMRAAQRVLRPKGVSIDDRPIIVAKKKRIGDWEGDTVESKDHLPGVNTLLERKTGLYLITRLKNKSSSATIEAVEKRMSVIPIKAKHTLTLDNGPENRPWREIEKQTGLSVFFAHPYCSGERGANENTNGLLRDYFSKKTDFGTISNEALSLVEYRLNTRPRKRLGWRTPLEAWSVAIGD